MSAFWLSQYTAAVSQPGIEKLLENTKSKEDFQVIIPFTNNVIEVISNVLDSNLVNFTLHKVKEAQTFCNDKAEFISKSKRDTVLLFTSCLYS
ncbi:MAG: hypothetical protein IPP53_12455 [Bacteroidetes bacterium]|nr:hypothetical protein [Bacteroidota bacterium]